jgi:hypothetical protein
MTAYVFAQENAGVLLRSFLIALVLVAPIALWQWSRIRARRSAAPDGHPGEAVTDATTAPAPSDPRSLEEVVARIAELSARTPVGEVVSIEVPAGATVEGRPVPPSVSDPIVQDSLQREGFDLLARTPADDGSGASVFECQRR